MLRALVSIHDVMPETRHAVNSMLQQLQQTTPRLTPATMTLLVVPGRQWHTEDLRWLHSLAQQGHHLAGHGWSHQSLRPRTLYHLAHSAFLSRRAAEHLSRSPQDLLQRLDHCHRWFGQQHLPTPTLYVPPAWATGNLTISQWCSTSFQQLETLSSVHHLSHHTRQSLPLSGYEADTPLRALFLRHFNHRNLMRARHRGQPIRIGLHPFDLKYALAQNALQDIAAVDEFLSYPQLSCCLTA